MECSSGKIPHHNREAAEAHARSIQQKDGHLPHIYTCKDCGFLHIGGGRKSDRPAWIQTHSGPVLPPDQLPRKTYERRQVDQGESVALEDAVRDYYQKNPLTTDEEVAERFGMIEWRMRNLRAKLHIPGRAVRVDQVVLAALKKDPSAHRGRLQKELGIGYSALVDRIKKLGFSGTGLHSRRGIKHQNFGKRMSAEQKAKLREAAVKQWSSPEARAAKSEQQRSWAEAHPDIVVENLKGTHQKLLTPEIQHRKSEGLKKHYATLTPEQKKARVQKAIAAQKPPSNETRKKIAEGVRAAFQAKKAKAAGAGDQSSS